MPLSVVFKIHVNVNIVNDEMQMRGTAGHCFDVRAHNFDYSSLNVFVGGHARMFSAHSVAVGIRFWPYGSLNIPQEEVKYFTIGPQCGKVALSSTFCFLKSKEENSLAIYYDAMPLSLRETNMHKSRRTFGWNKLDFDTKGESFAQKRNSFIYLFRATSKGSFLFVSSRKIKGETHCDLLFFSR